MNEYPEELDMVKMPPELFIPGEEWRAPQPLSSKINSEPYPLDAIPSIIGQAIKEVQSFVKAPTPLVASSALGMLSLTCQGYANVKRAEKLSGPIGLFLLTIADSGERKSTCDGFFSSAMRNYQKTQAEILKPEMDRYFAELDAWKAIRDGILQAIKSAGKSGKPTEQLKADLVDLQQREPLKPLVPRLLLGDETPENLAWSLAKLWPSSGIVSSEAGTVLGSHGMGADSIMRNLGLLNVLWDGGNHSIGRRTSESFTVSGARLTVALQIQEPTLREFFSKSGTLARGTGFLARFLISWPDSTQGYRQFSEAPTNWPYLSAFNKKIESVLGVDLDIDDNGVLNPKMLSMDHEAKEAWIKYHNAIESELNSCGQLYDVRDVASKTADNAVRLAALFHIFEHGTDGEIDVSTFNGASRIAAWHLNESRRFFGEIALPDELIDAQKLNDWLTDYCRTKGIMNVSRREVQQFGPIRAKLRLDDAINMLEELDRVHLIKDGKKKTLSINPLLLVKPS